jgi:hypothetical protein
MPSRNEVVIAHLDNIIETYAGSPVAKEAASLRRLLASAKQETVQRHLQSFAEAAAKAGQSGTTKKMKTAAKKTAFKMATKSRIRMKAAPKTKPAAKSGMQRRDNAATRLQSSSAGLIIRNVVVMEIGRSVLFSSVAKQLQQLAWAGTAVGVATKYFSCH